MRKFLLFSATWCKPCETLKNSLKLLPEEIEVQEIDTTEDPESARKYAIRALPTFIKLNDEGNEVARKVGALDFTLLHEFVTGEVTNG
jgi:thiol-disulfide isomerase/thioredoxin